MPELPDITAYIAALDERVKGHTLEKVRLNSPFLLRSINPPLRAVEGKKVLELRRIGKRIAFALDDELWLVLHLMIAGRLHWEKPGKKLPGRRGLAAFDFDNGTLVLTEAGTKRRASLQVVRGKEGLQAIDPGGMEVMGAPLKDFAQRLRLENHTLKRSLTDPRMFSGIGNAYSDEILHHAKLSPVALTQKLSDEEIARLHGSIQQIMNLWIDRLLAESQRGFPEKVTAFRPEMAVHGKFGQPCPVCGAKVQRIRYSENETNYCPVCQTGGKLLADRSLSMLLKKDWPRTADELEYRILTQSRGGNP